MQKELKDAIIKNVQAKAGHFQVVNTTIENFREYIYDSKGEYLIGGEEVKNFISDFIKLYE